MRVDRVLADAFEHTLVVERLLAVVERGLLQIELLFGLLRIGGLCRRRFAQRPALSVSVTRSFTIASCSR